MNLSRGALAGLFVALVALVTAGTALGSVRIKKVDLAGYPTVRVVVFTSKDTPRAPSLFENGKPAPYVDASRDQAKSVVLAIDRSHSMSGGVLASATAAARKFVAAKPLPDRVALFSFGSKPLQLSSFGTDTIDVDSGLRALSVDGGQGTRLYDTVVLASLALKQTPRPRVLVLLTDGRDFYSRSSLQDAVDVARAAGVSIYAIGMKGAQLTPGPLRRLASETGGTYYPADRTEAFLTRTYAQIADELKRTWNLEYLSARRPGETVRLLAKAGSVGTATAVAAIPPGEATKVDKGSWIGDLRTHWWGALLIGLVFGVIVLALLKLIFTKPRKVWLRERLQLDADRPEPAALVEDGEAKAGVLGSLFAATETRFSDFKFWRKLEQVLEQGDASLRPAQLFYMSVGIAVGLALIAAAFGASPVFIVVLIVVGAIAPYLYFARKASKRLQAFEDELPAALNTMAGSLKAGHSFRQAIQTIVDEGGPPIDGEFSRALNETRLGRPIEAALADMGRRVGSTELDFALRAVAVQQQVGGSLAGLFELLAETLTQRHQFRQKVRTLTAQGKLTAMILIGLPFAIGILLSLISPGYLNPLFNTGAGQVLIVLGLVMMTIGTLFLRHITSFKGYR
jgi:tight adherence protein B